MESHCFTWRVPVATERWRACCWRAEPTPIPTTTTSGPLSTWLPNMGRHGCVGSHPGHAAERRGMLAAEAEGPLGPPPDLCGRPSPRRPRPHPPEELRPSGTSHRQAGQSAGEVHHVPGPPRGASSRRPSQDNGLDGPYGSGAGKLEQVKLMPPAPNDDLASLSELTDSSLMYEMQKRFGNDQIYTYIGHILLLVNPNKDLPIYSTLVNCILEAFGHAKTPKNHNSSRFIKLVTLQYCDKTLLRAHLSTYMLEKWRLAPLPQQQLSFSVFHLMAEGLSAEEKSPLYLTNLLRGTGESPAVAAASTQSRERLGALRHALRALGFNKQEVESVFGLLAAVLHVGDLRFTPLTDAETAHPSDLQLLERGDAVTRRHAVDVSEQCRDQLARALYSRLFSYLVNSINRYLQGQDDSPGDPSLEIRILDIFGFEEFQRNGFEQADACVCVCVFQLCVNMINERLRQHVSEVLFQQEQEECLQEGVAMETVLSPGNGTTVLDFFLQ
ncbi:hypothetical protein NHX12_007151, partial [Muraenolepis orangiensis]